MTGRVVMNWMYVASMYHTERIVSGLLEGRVKLFCAIHLETTLVKFR